MQMCLISLCQLCFLLSISEKNPNPFKLSLNVLNRKDKTIERAVPFPAPVKGDNRGLSPFHPRKIIVFGECPLLSPEAIFLFVPFPVPCLPNNFFPGSPETIDSFFHPLPAYLMTA